MSAVNRNQKQWKLIDLLNWTAEYLKNKGFENGRLETERLLAHTLGLRRIDLYVNFDRPLIQEELAAFKGLLQRRLNHEPLQYILGETEFYSLNFKVAPGVLIPRPETEILVDEIIKSCKSDFAEYEDLSMLDVGTGSGIIAIAAAVNEPRLKVTAVDSSETAIEIARHNADQNNVSERIEFVLLNALEPLPEKFHGKFDIIASNPPYVSASEYEKLMPEIKDYEPEQALVAGELGLDFYDKFSLQLPALGKNEFVVLFEIGEKQADHLISFFKSLEFEKIEVVKDLADKDRIIKMRRRL